MFCSRCGTLNLNSDEFCKSCSGQLNNPGNVLEARFCSRCGTHNLDGDEICRNCSRQLHNPGNVLEASENRSNKAVRSYVLRDLAEILSLDKNRGLSARDTAVNSSDPFKPRVAGDLEEVTLDENRGPSARDAAVNSSDPFKPRVAGDLEEVTLDENRGPSARDAAVDSSDPFKPRVAGDLEEVTSDVKQNSSIFISYRRDDSEGQAGRLYDGLSSHFTKNKIFMDIDTIEPGEDFVEAIEREIGCCGIMLVIIGKRWLTNTDSNGRRRLDNPEDFVRLEIATALSRDTRVIPILVQGAAMPSSEELPADIAKLARRNAFEISSIRWQYDVGRLIQIMEKTLRP